MLLVFCYWAIFSWRLSTSPCLQLSVSTILFDDVNQMKQFSFSSVLSTHHSLLLRQSIKNTCLKQCPIQFLSLFIITPQYCLDFIYSLQTSLISCHFYPPPDLHFISVESLLILLRKCPWVSAPYCSATQLVNLFLNSISLRCWCNRLLFLLNAFFALTILTLISAEHARYSPPAL